WGAHADSEAGLLGGGLEGVGGRVAGQDQVDVGPAEIGRGREWARVGQPVVRDGGNDRFDCVGRDFRSQLAAGPGDRGGDREQDVVGYLWEGRAGASLDIGPGVLEIERGAVVDQPELAVPDQQV